MKPLNEFTQEEFDAFHTKMDKKGYNKEEWVDGYFVYDKNLIDATEGEKVYELIVRHAVEHAFFRYTFDIPHVNYTGEVATPDVSTVKKVMPYETTTIAYKEITW